MKKIISFVFITLLSISIFSQSIPVQKNTKQGRTETLKEISFMSFDYTSKRDDVISYFNKYGVEFVLPKVNLDFFIKANKVV